MNLSKINTYFYYYIEIKYEGTSTIINSVFWTISRFLSVF